MPRFGQYITVAEIHRGGLGSVWSARSEADSRVRFAIKTCVPDADIIGYDAAEAAVRLFIEQATVQQKLGRADGSVWAPIHDYGRVTAEDAAASAAEMGEEAPAGAPIGAYYVTDLCGRSSVERVVGSRIRLDVRGITAILRAVVAGLGQCKQVGGRPHGNLRPSNVLLSGEGEVDRLRVLLTDPLPTSRVDVKRDEQADVRAVGELLCALVTLQPFRMRSAGEVPDSPEWNRLPGGQRWRALCTQLVDPDPTHERPTLEGTAESIEKLAQPGVKTKKVAVMGGAAALLLMGAIVLGWAMWPKKPPVPPPPPPEGAKLVWKQVCDEYLDWFGTFASVLPKKPDGTFEGGTFATRRDLYKTDPALRTIVEKIDGATGPLNPRTIAGSNLDLERLRDAPTEKAMSPDGLRDTSGLAAIIKSVRDGMSDGGWKMLGEFKSAAAKLEEAGLKSEGEFIRSRVGAAEAMGEEPRPGAPRDLAGAIDNIMAMGPAVVRLRAQLVKLEERRGRLKGAGDPVLGALAGWFDEQVKARAKGGAVTSLGELQEVLRGLEQDDTLGERFDRFLADRSGAGWENIDRELYQKSGSAAYAAVAAGQKLGAEEFETWLREAARYPKISSADDRRSDTLVLLNEVKEERARLEKESKKPLPAEEGARIDKLGTDLEELRGRAWNAVTRPGIIEANTQIQSVLVAEKQSLKNRVETILASKAANATELRNQLARTVEIVPDSPERVRRAVNEFWVEERDRLMRAFPDEKFEELGIATQTLKEKLAEFERAVPAGLEAGGQATAWSAAIAAESWRARDRMIKGALAGWKQEQGGAIDPSSQSFGEMQARVVGEFGAWLPGAQKLVAELGRAEEMLGEAYGLGEALPNGVTLRTLEEGWKDSALLKVPAVGEGAAAITGRIAGLHELEGVRDPAALVRAAGSDPQAGPERKLNAWRRLGEEGMAWPSSVEQLRQEQGVAGAVDAVVAGIGNKERRDLLGAQVAGERAARWTRCFGGLREPAEIEAAATLIEAFGVKGESLPAALLYNVLLAAFRQACRENQPDPLVAERIGAFRRSAGGLEVASRGEVDAFLKSLDALVSGQEEAPKIATTKLGPGSLPESSGWVGNDEGPTLSFTRAGAAGRVPLTLHFIRVDQDETGKPLGEDAFFLSATEVTLRQFMGIVEAAGLGKDLPVVLHAMTADKAETDRNGPCVWTTRDGKKITVTDEWLLGSRPMVDGSHPMYPDELRDTNDTSGRKIVGRLRPTEDHPMQQLSPVCAMLVARAVGCQLPTSAQWKAAYRMESEDGQKRTPNLRDATWLKQFNHIIAMREKLRQEKKVSSEGFNWPDVGVFPDWEGENARPDASAPDDKVLWFAPAGQQEGATSGFHHLRGNVAEMVVDAPPPPAERVTLRAVVSYLRTNRGKVGVIGGSSLSSAKAPDAWRQAQPMDLTPDETQPSEGYADVGFRLAFSAKGSAPARPALATTVRERLEAGGKYLLPP